MSGPFMKKQMVSQTSPLLPPYRLPLVFHCLGLNQRPPRACEGAQARENLEKGRLTTREAGFILQAWVCC